MWLPPSSSESEPRLPPCFVFTTSAVSFVLPSEKCRPEVHRQSSQVLHQHKLVLTAAHVGGGNIPGTIRTSVCRVFTNLLVELLGRCSMATHVCMQAVPEKIVRAIIRHVYLLFVCVQHGSIRPLPPSPPPAIHNGSESIPHNGTVFWFDTCLFVSFAPIPGVPADAT